MVNDYSRQAAVWDWDAFDDSAEHEFWCDVAARYGSNVLIPMCAHGQAGAYMAGKGFCVTAFDLSPEMIAEGRKRYGGLKNLALEVGDLLNLSLKRNDFDFAYIAGYGDLHLLDSIEQVDSAFRSLYRHLKVGGGLTLEFSLPQKVSSTSPKRTFHPRVPRYSDKKIWKDSEGFYDADRRQQTIKQTVYIEDADGIDTFCYTVRLQYFEREAVLNALKTCGFAVKGLYRNRQMEPWTSGEDTVLVETVRL